MKLEERARPFVENVAEAGTACLFTMVQGNVLAITLGHWLAATQTGVAAGAVTFAAIAATRVRRAWVVSLTLGVATALVDYFVHPGGFGPFFMEAAVTGLGAGVLSYAVHWAAVRYRRARALRDPGASDDVEQQPG